MNLFGRKNRANRISRTSQKRLFISDTVREICSGRSITSRGIGELFFIVDRECEPCCVCRCIHFGPITANLLNMIPVMFLQILSTCLQHRRGSQRHRCVQLRCTCYDIRPNTYGVIIALAFGVDTSRGTNPCVTSRDLGGMLARLHPFLKPPGIFCFSSTHDLSRGTLQFIFRDAREVISLSAIVYMGVGGCKSIK